MMLKNQIYEAKLHEQSLVTKLKISKNHNQST